MEEFFKKFENLIETAEKESIKDMKKMSVFAGLKMICGQIIAYIKNSAKTDIRFADKVGQNHKTPERMLKYIFNNAKEISVSMAGVNGSWCCVPSAVVFNWITDYFNLDDKEDFEAEEKKKAEAKKKAEEDKKKAEEIKKKAEAQALEKLSEDEEYKALSEEDKAKRLKKEISDIEYKLKQSENRKEAAKKRKAKKVEEKTTKDSIAVCVEEESVIESQKEALKKELTNNEIVDMEKEAEITADSKIPEEKVDVSKTDSTSVVTPTYEDSEGQFSLFDLVMA